MSKILKMMLNFYGTILSPNITTTRQNQHNDVRQAKSQISLCIHTVWSESSLCAQLVANDPSFLHADSDDSDQTADLSLRWAQMSFGWFCHEAAKMSLWTQYSSNKT